MNPISPGGRSQGETFYSQRADGPYYRWVCTDGSGGWRYSRVSLDRLELNVLCVARWDAVPSALRDRLGEHYLE